jgi:hypothetical protein
MSPAAEAGLGGAGLVSFKDDFRGAVGFDMLWRPEFTILSKVASFVGYGSR